jgi:hypothetical protein
MTIEELKLIIGYFGVLGVGGVIGGGIMWFIVKSFIPDYLAAKGKNLATKEDIGAITREVELVKNEFAVQLKELEHQKALLTEGFKSSLSQQQESVRTVNAAVVELTKKLAAGSHLISWLSWGATQPNVTLSVKDFRAYDKGMIKVMSDLEVGKARDLFGTNIPGSVQQAIAILNTTYQGSIAFDKSLLVAVTGMLQSSPARG